MIKDVVIKKLNKFNDNRGWLAEFFRNDETDYDPAMGYISVTKPGVVRGPHEHAKQSDCFIFAGPGKFELHLWDRRKKKWGRTEEDIAKKEHIKIEAGPDNPTMIIVPPGVVHGYKCVSEHDGWCINLPDKLYKGKDKKDEIDEIRWEEDESSPYKIN